MHAQLIPTTLCEEATDAFADLLKGRADDGLNDEHFARDWSSLWDELVRDGWTAIADSADGDFSLLDLTAFARVWGRYLVPLPFVPTLVARRGLATPPEPGARLSYAAAEPGLTLMPYGPVAAAALTADGLVEAANLAEALGVDDWAASAPVTLLPAGVGPALARSGARAPSSRPLKRSARPPRCSGSRLTMPRSGSNSGSPSGGSRPSSTGWRTCTVTWNWPPARWPGPASNRMKPGGP